MYESGFNGGIFRVLLFLLVCCGTSFSQVKKPFAEIRWSENPDGTEEIPEISVEMETELLTFVNRLRKSRALHPLKFNPSLTLAARYHAADMAYEEYFEHETHNERYGEDCKEMGTFDRVRKFLKGSNVLARGENIAAGQRNAQAAYVAWRDSPGHYKNLMDPGAVWIGIGYFYKEDSKYGTYWVMDTGTSQKALTSQQTRKKKKKRFGLRRMVIRIFK